MPELHVKAERAQEAAELFLRRFAEDWACELQPLPSGYLLLPEVMLRKYGIFLFYLEAEEGPGVRICREDDATTWEDFLLMRLSHSLAAETGAELILEGRDDPLAVSPEKFATFEHYVDTVLEREDDWVREMKRQWIYSHRQRSLR